MMKKSQEDIRKRHKKQECSAQTKIKKQETVLNNNKNFIQKMDKRKAKVGSWPKKTELENKVEK